MARPTATSSFFNADKSAFTNALVGRDVTAEGSLPTTERVTILKHGS